jgi:hypothetical protein
MSFLGLLLILAVIGVLAWAVVKFIPMPPNIATLIYVVAGIVAFLYVLQAFGLIAGLTALRVPTVVR